MDKQMIEEMAKVIEEAMAKARRTLGGHNNIAKFYATMLVNAGYRKIPENAVVLTDDELYEELNTCKVAMIVHDDDGEKYVSLDDYNEYTERLGKIASQRKARIEQLEKLLDDRCDRCIERERNETVDKFVEMARLKSRHAFVNVDDNPREDRFLYLTDVDEIAKEIKEGL